MGNRDNPKKARDPNAKNRFVEKFKVDAPKVYEEIPVFKNNGAVVSSRQKKFKRIISIVFAVFVVGVIAYTAFSDFGGNKAGNPSEIFAIVGENWKFLAFALLSFIGILVASSLKYGIMIYATTKKIRMRLAFETCVYGKYYDNITPLGTGGQPFQAYHLTKNGVPAGNAVSIPVASFFLTQLAFVMLVLFSFFMIKNNNIFQGAVYDTTKVFAIIGVTFSIMIPAVVVLFSFMPKVSLCFIKGIINLAARFKLVKRPELMLYKSIKTVELNIKSLKQIASNWFALIMSFVLSVAEWALLCSIGYFTLKAFGYDIVGIGGMTEWFRILEISMILYSAISFIPTPGNSGAADLSFYGLFVNNLQSVAGLGFSAMFFWRILNYYLFVVLGFSLVLINNLRAKKTSTYVSPALLNNVPLTHVSKDTLREMEPLIQIPERKKRRSAAAEKQQTADVETKNGVPADGGAAEYINSPGE